MFCAECGNQIPDDSVVCSFCGKPVAGQQAAADPAPAGTPAGGSGITLDPKVKKLAIILGAAVVVLIIVAMLFGGNSAGKAVEKYYKAMAKFDFSDYSKSTIYNKKCLKKLDVWDDDAEEDLEDTEEQFDDMKETMKDNDYKVTVKTDVKDTTTYKSGDKEFNWYMAYFEDKYNFDTDAIKAVAVVKVRVKTTISDDGDKESNTETVEETAIKVGGNWYVVPNCPSKDTLKNRYKD